jgi:hypothetical protein
MNLSLRPAGTTANFALIIVMKQTVDAVTNLEVSAPGLSWTFGEEFLDLAVWDLVMTLMEEMFSL